MTAVDTSVSVPALLTWHEHHDSCRVAADGARIPAHALLESYSVLTRLPSAHGLPADVVRGALRQWYPAASILAAPAGLQRSVVDLAESAGVSGGAVYDALVGLIAKHHDETLLTRDVRARAVYDALAIDYQFLPTA